MGLWSKLTGGADRERFIEEALDVIGAQFGEAEYVASSFSVIAGPHTIFLDNIWGEYKRARSDERLAVIERLVSNQAELATPSPETFEQARPRLRPMLHDKIYWSVSRLKMESVGVDVASLPEVRPFAEHLMMSIALDLPKTMRFIVKSDCADWKCDFDQLLAAARENILRTSNVRWSPAQHGVWGTPWTDGYGVARLIAPALFRDLGTRGAPVVLPLNAGVVYVAGADDTEGLVALAEAGRQVFELPKPISPIPLVLDGERWVELKLADGHPAKEAFDLLRYEFLNDQYAQQTAMLKGLPGAENHAFIAAYKVMRAKTGEVTSTATLTAMLPTLLPKADLIGIVMPGPTREDYKMLATVPWDAFAGIVPLQQDHDLAPPRYFSDGALDDAQQAALVAAKAF